jgi:hypothetical protein
MTGIMPCVLHSAAVQITKSQLLQQQKFQLSSSFMQVYATGSEVDALLKYHTFKIFSTTAIQKIRQLI